MDQAKGDKLMTLENAKDSPDRYWWTKAMSWNYDWWIKN